MADVKKQQMSYLYTISSKEAIEIMANPAIKEAIFLGPPGIGKTAMAFEAAHMLAKSMSRVLVTVDELKNEKMLKEVIENPSKYFIVAYFRMGTVNPEDLTGIPSKNVIRVNNNVVIEYMSSKPFLELGIYEILRRLGKVEGLAGMIVFDEVTGNIQENPLKADAVAAIFGERKIGADIRIPKGIKLVGLGNRPGETYTAEPLPEHITGRVPTFIVAAPTVDEWLVGLKLMEQAAEKNDFLYTPRIDPSITAFIKANADMLYNTSVKDEATGTPIYPTPRGWTRAGIALAKIVEEINRRNNTKFTSVVDVIRYLRTEKRGIRGAYTVFSNADDFIRLVTTIVSGLVGRPAAAKYEAFVSVDVPSAVELLRKGELTSFLQNSELNVKFLVLASAASYITYVMTSKRTAEFAEALLSGVPDMKKYSRVKEEVVTVINMLKAVKASSLSDLSVLLDLITSENALGTMYLIMNSTVFSSMVDSKLTDAIASKRIFS